MAFRICKTGLPTVMSRPVYYSESESPTASGTTGTRGAATTADRIGRGNAESGPWAGFDVFDIDGAAGFKQVIFDQEGQVALVVYFIVFFRLIQSQAQ